MLISVVIPTHNGRHLLAANLPQIFAAAKNHEIIIVDDASTDDTVAWLESTYPTIKLIINSRNLRFAKAVNRGVTQAHGEIVVLLNNDVRPQANFLGPLIAPFADPQVFAVGCQEINQDHGHSILGGRGVGKFSRGLLVHARAKDQTRHATLWVTAGSGAFRKGLWDKLGGLDPLYRPAYGEDQDLSYTALKSGYKVMFAPDSQVNHVHETTNLRTFGAWTITAVGFKNQFLFVWKNISSLRLLLQHLFWLPYHLILTNIRSRGLLVIGFFLALTQLPQALLSRSRVSKFWTTTDEQILATNQT